MLQLLFSYFLIISKLLTNLKILSKMSIIFIPSFSFSLLPCQYLFLAVVTCLVITSVTCTEPGQSEDVSPQGWLLSPEMLAYMTAALFIMFSNEPSPAHSQTRGEQRPAPTIFRKRRSVGSIFLELGPTYVKCAIVWMKPPSGFFTRCLRPV